MQEIEAKFLNIDPQRIQEKLAASGATKAGEFFYRSRVFDYPDWRLDEVNSWLRLRDEGNRTVLTFKKRLGAEARDGSKNDEGMEEIEVEVSDFAKTAEMLLKLGFIEKHYAEKKRTRWMKGDIEFDIDYWPGLTPHLEIEAPSWARVEEGARLAGVDFAARKVFSGNQLYALAGMDVAQYTRLAFDGLVKRKT